MSKKLAALFGVIAFAIVVVCVAGYGSRKATAAEGEVNAPSLDSSADTAVAENGFSVEVLIGGASTAEYAARGRRYVEALENAEYELRIHNPTSSRVAVALSVDGLNTIDARHTTAWDAHKWVVEPYGTISVRGWQMSSENARRFYFTTERDSYAAKLGQAANLGVISAVFFRERAPITILRATPAEPKRGADKDERAPMSMPQSNSTGSSAGESEDVTRAPGKQRSVQPYPPPDDESAATGIGRSVRNDVQWIKMDLDPRPAGEVMVRYEYRAALVRLGIIPRDYPRPNTLDRRERAQGFEPKYCPVP